MVISYSGRLHTCKSPCTVNMQIYEILYDYTSIFAFQAKFHVFTSVLLLFIYTHLTVLQHLFMHCSFLTVHTLEYYCVNTRHVKSTVVLCACMTICRCKHFQCMYMYIPIMICKLKPTYTYMYLLRMQIVRSLFCRFLDASCKILNIDGSLLVSLLVVVHTCFTSICSRFKTS